MICSNRRLDRVGGDSARIAGCRSVLGAVLVACAISGKCPAEEKKVSAGPASRWAQIEAVFGAVNLDGTLRLSFPMGTSRALEQLGIRLELQHAVGTDAEGRGRSEWRLQGLQSSLAPVARTWLRWQPPAGAPVNFERAKVTRRLTDAGSARWLIRESGPAECEIRSRDGKAWRYRRGLLVGCEHPALGVLRITTQGAWITSIERTDAAPGDTLLFKAGYDESGRLTGWQIGSEKPNRLTWVDSRLIGWRRSDDSELRVDYRDGLVSGISESGKPARSFAWRENPGHDRGDSRWAAPVHLASDEANSYSYGLSSKGFLLKREEHSGGVVTTTVFNPRRNRLEQKGGGTQSLVVFHRGKEGAALQRIEIDGEVVERYAYDEGGQLVSLQRQGEPERSLSYDESGRLMGLEVKAPPAPPSL